MRKEFIVERHGRSFCLYAGLLDLAHQQGLRTIQTRLLQIPADDNGRTAIVEATVMLEEGGRERTFTGLGDASPANVAPAMQQCLIRMAETRAKARAMRDAVNVGVTALEELADDDVRDDAPERPARQMPAAPTRVREESPRASQPAHESRQDSDSVTSAQVSAIENLCKRGGVESNDLAKERFGADSISSLTQSQASEIIKGLNERNAAQRTAPRA